jgi:hypothetical protein
VTGESDGKFDPGDAIYFFGQKFRGPEMDQKYTDERVYWLDTGGAPGPRIVSLPATPQYDRTPPRDFPTTVRAEENMQWWTLHTINLDTQDTWFWHRAQPLGQISQSAVITASLPYTAPYPAPGAGATLRVEQISRVNSPSVNPDHRTTIAFNGAAVADVSWDGLRVRKVFSAPVDAAALKHGENVAQIGVWKLAGLSGDDVYTNYWELDYRREFKAYQGQVDFRAETAGPQEYEVTGWENGPVWIWDVSNPNAPAQMARGGLTGNRVYLPFITQSAEPKPGTTAIRFRAVGVEGSRYWMQAQPTFNAPASVRRRPPTYLRAATNRADVVIVAPANLRAAAQPLAQWHQANGRRALIADIQDVYDEFNEGITHPKAIQTMLKWAASNWTAPAPQYLTLVGDGHWNFKGYNTAQYPAGPNPIPPYLVWVDPTQGEVPSDSILGDLNNDGAPEVAVGRLPVNTTAEANTVIQKIINYDQGTRVADWQKRAVFVADNVEPGGDFPGLSDQIIATYLPASIQPQRVYLPGASPEQIVQTRQALSSTLQAGALMVQFSGHGAPFRWTHEMIWHANDVPGLKNGDKLPVVVTFNCLDGYFVHTDPAQTSLAELMLRQPGGGSVAAISPTGLGYTSEQHEFRSLLMNVLFTENVQELGRALNRAKKLYHDKHGAHYLIDTMTLFGDPAMKLPKGAQ